MAATAERTVTSPSNPTALVIASATCLIVISSFSPTVRELRLQPRSSRQRIIRARAKREREVENRRERANVPDKMIGSISGYSVCDATQRQQTMISAPTQKSKTPTMSQPGPAAHKPRTFELPDEEFCEVARVDELPERGTRTRDGEGRAVLCERVASGRGGGGGGTTTIERKKNSQPSCCRFRGRRRCQIAPGKRIRGATHNSFF